VCMLVTKELVCGLHFMMHNNAPLLSAVVQFFIFIQYIDVALLLICFVGAPRC